jgi:LuxR family maltose regulon positive regulatory protein
MSPLFQQALISAKISIPSPGTQVVARPRLAEKLRNGLQRPLTVISAPAGFGKTTLVSSTLREQADETRVAWLSLDQEDGHLIRFLYHLVATLQSVAPDVGRAPIFLIGRLQLPAPNDLIAALVSEIADSAYRIVLVLDDYHIVPSPEINAAVTYLVEHMPEPLHVILISRKVPDLPLARWRTQQRLSEIGLDDLRFSLEESSLYLELAMGLSLNAELVRTLEQKTEGWIAGLQMAVLSMQHSADKESMENFAQRVASFSGEHRHVLAYLAEEVFSHQTPEVQDFLRGTSGLDRLCASLCDAVTGRQNSRNMLNHLEQANMFLLRLDETRNWYRYHQLFAEFLCTESDADKRRQQHLNASQWYEANGFEEEAIRHSFAAKDFPSTVRLFRAFADNVLARGELSKLRSWLDEFPDDLVRAHSDLACYKSWTLYLSGHTAQAQPYAKLARELESENDPRERRGMLAAIHAYIALSWGDPRDAVAYAKQALEQLGDSASFFLVYAKSLLGQAQVLIGDRVAAVETLRKGVQLGQQLDNHFMTVDAMGPLIDLMLLQGQLREAKAICMNGIERYVDAKGSSAPVAALLYIRLGVLDYEQNDLNAARYRLQTGIELSSQLGMVFFKLLGLRALAKLQHVCGEREAAWDTLAEASEIAERPESVRRRRLIALVVAELQLREGNIDGSARTLDETRALVGRSLEEEDLLVARIYLARHQPTRAFNVLVPLEQNAQKDGFHGSLIAIQVLQALCKRAIGEKAAAARYLASAVSLAASAGYRRVFLDEGRSVAEILGEIRHVDPGFVNELIESFAADDETLPTAVLHESLSRMEREILKLVSLGLTNQQTAEKLGITVSTTKWYLTQMFSKLNVRNRTQAIARARQLGLL